MSEAVEKSSWIGIALLVGIIVFVYYSTSMKSKDISNQDYDSVLVPVTSTVDHKQYKVLNGPSQQAAADLLATVGKQAGAVVDELQNQLNKQLLSDHFAESIERVQAKRPFNLAQLDPEKEHTVAYNISKGDQIYLCLKGRDDNSLADRDVLLSVLLHELAHIMETTFSDVKNGFSVHSKEFKENEKLLLTTAASMELLSPSAVIGRNFCNISVPDPKSAQ